MYNRIILIGNLTRDPELRYTPQGIAVASFGLAVSTRTKSKEESKEETLFMDIVVWGKQGETVSQYLSKGRQALVEGRLRERKWEGSDGQQKKRMEVVADNVRFLGKKDDSTGGRGAQGSSQSTTPPDEITDIEPF